ncbi:hypothetical protein [Sediminitomix flava]|uniref:SUKH-4 immunity protein of toxin-antitoxin system n=1 Tax=Sediminitomix flava TaxID=379075 RepID=A0A315YUX3_SEDFL|nr:hypothetical protein [Sediminitomix flava]PWJ32683.1 hypothetical protein BC781_1201 [Sediminitomix flava]
MISHIKSDKSSDQLIRELMDLNIEVGMVEFTDKEDLLRLPSSFEKIGNFELDILAIDIDSELVVMIDHDKPDFIMGKVAQNITQFVEALKLIEAFFEMSMEDDELYADEEAMRKVTSKSSSIAGDQDYLWFYDMMLGI